MSEIAIADELKRLSRRIEALSKTTDMLMEDRNILEDILTRLTALENAMRLQRATATENVKTINANINEVQAIVESKIDEVNLVTDDKTVIVKAPTENIIQKVLHKMGR
jgi:archaellum component FlaC